MAAVLRVGFIGAGKVNFGTTKGPWDHASRLERLDKVQVVGIADPLEAAGQSALDKRRAGKYAHVYTDCDLYSSVEELLQGAKPHMVVVGTPPFARGDFAPGKDIELQCMRAGVHVLVEKPVSLSAPSDFRKYAAEVEKAQAQSGAILSVGYMFRYHAAVRKMKEIIASHGGHVMSLNATYLFAYEHACGEDWWDVRRSGGPVVEQATHLCDLARYLAGDVDETTIRTYCVRDKGPSSAGHLTKVPSNCDKGLPEEARPPRVTMAQWRFTSGGLGSLTHVIGLHCTKYEAHLEVIMDGLRLYLDDVYTSDCNLRVRTPESEEDDVYLFPDDDPYMTQITDFIRAVRKNDSSGVESTYSDATKTYCMTWAIRDGETK